MLYAPLEMALSLQHTLVVQNFTLCRLHKAIIAHVCDTMCAEQLACFYLCEQETKALLIILNCTLKSQLRACIDFRMLSTSVSDSPPASVETISKHILLPIHQLAVPRMRSALCADGLHFCAFHLEFCSYGVVCIAVEINYEMIKDLILNQTVRANLALFIVAGLPFSGKSTVLKKLLNSSG